MGRMGDKLQNENDICMYLSTGVCWRVLEVLEMMEETVIQRRSLSLNKRLSRIIYVSRGIQIQTVAVAVDEASGAWNCDHQRDVNKLQQKTEMCNEPITMPITTKHKSNEAELCKWLLSPSLWHCKPPIDIGIPYCFHTIRLNQTPLQMLKLNKKLNNFIVFTVDRELKIKGKLILSLKNKKTI